MLAMRLDESATAIITAGAAGVKKNATLNVEPEGPTSVSLEPNATTGGAKVIATVTRVPSPEVLTVQLTSNNAAATLPASVTFDPNSSSERVTISTEPVPSRTTVLINAKKGAVTKGAQLSLNPPAVTQITLSPTQVVGGQDFVVRFTLNGRAPPGFVVRVTKFYGDGRSSPYDVEVPVNATTGGRTLFTDRVDQERRITVRAETSSGSQSATLTIYPQR